SPNFRNGSCAVSFSDGRAFSRRGKLTARRSCVNRDGKYLNNRSASVRSGILFRFFGIVGRQPSSIAVNFAESFSNSRFASSFDFKKDFTRSPIFVEAFAPNSWRK